MRHLTHAVQVINLALITAIGCAVVVAGICLIGDCW